MFYGIDISHWQKEVNWDAVRIAKINGNPIEFVFIKASEGVWYKDPKYEEYKAGCIQVGLRHGAYHFWHSNQDPIKQAENFYRSAGSGIKAYVCDVETNDGGEFKDNLRTFLQKIEDLSGQRPLVYTGPYFWIVNGIHDEQFCSYYKLWIAHYTQLANPLVPAGWTNWLFWQYSDKGVISGIPGNTVDLNRFAGTQAELQLIFGNGGEYMPIELPKIVRVTATTLYIRKTPGGSIVGYMPNGFEAHVTGSAYDVNGKLWYRSGSNGYFASWFTEIVE